MISAVGAALPGADISASASGQITALQQQLTALEKQLSGASKSAGTHTAQQVRALSEQIIALQSQIAALEQSHKKAKTASHEGVAPTASDDSHVGQHINTIA